tara:strand:+ start:6193 stop:6423 length:231 start_codon:yes stop_codon:yes gene_type:complete
MIFANQNWRKYIDFENFFFLSVISKLNFSRSEKKFCPGRKKITPAGFEDFWVTVGSFYNLNRKKSIPFLYPQLKSI